MTGSQKSDGYEVDVVVITSTRLSSNLYGCGVALKYVASNMELVIQSDAVGEFAAQAVKYQRQGLIDQGPANQPNCNDLQKR